MRRWIRGSFVSYMLDPEEIWCRAYTQFIVERTCDGGIRAELDWVRQRVPDRVYYPRQWDDADFQPVAAAIDDLLKHLGWIQ